MRLSSASYQFHYSNVHLFILNAEKIFIKVIKLQPYHITFKSFPHSLCSVFLSLSLKPFFSSPLSVPPTLSFFLPFSLSLSLLLFYSFSLSFLLSSQSSKNLFIITSLCLSYSFYLSFFFLFLSLSLSASYSSIPSYLSLSLLPQSSKTFSLSPLSVSLFFFPTMRCSSYSTIYYSWLFPVLSIVLESWNSTKKIRKEWTIELPITFGDLVSLFCFDFSCTFVFSHTTLFSWVENFPVFISFNFHLFVSCSTIEVQITSYFPNKKIQNSYVSYMYDVCI